MQGKRTAWERVLAVFYPERCCCCGRVIACGAIVCRDCLDGLRPVLPPVCPLCGCGKEDCRCGGRRRHTDGCAASFYHEDSAKAALLRLKFSGKQYAAELFSEAMTQTVFRRYPTVRFDRVVSVPVGAKTRSDRGYNQSAVLARGMARRLDIPFDDLLVKLWETRPQRELPAYRRSGNILGAFDVMPGGEVKGLTFLLVDDVHTTGATLDECAKMLKIYGAEAVYAVTATVSRLSKQEK